MVIKGGAGDTLQNHRGRSGGREGEGYSPVAPTSATSPVTPQDIIVRHVEIDRVPPAPMLAPPGDHDGPD